MSTKILVVKPQETFGSRLREERLRVGISQVEAANACGVSREMWGRYERGIGSPGADVIARMAELGIDTHYAVTGEKSSGNSDSARGSFDDVLASLRSATNQAMELDLSEDHRVLVRDILFAITLQDAAMMRTVIDSYVQRHSGSVKP